MKQYLLDANIYVCFYDRAYWFESFPSFWESFAEVINRHVVLPKVVVDETNRSDEFKVWLTANYKEKYVNHKNYAQEWAEVIQHIARHPCYSEIALTDVRSWTHEKIADGWLIAIAKREGLTIVTDESPNINLDAQRPSKAVKIPDIAKDFGVKCITLNEFFKEIGFRL